MVDWVSRFLDAKRREGLSPVTLQKYEYALGMFRRDFGFNPVRFSVKDIERLLDKLSKGSPEYYRYNVILVKATLKFFGRGKIAGEIKLPRKKDKVEGVREKLLTPEEVKQLIDKADSLQDKLLIELLIESGARLGEIYNLRIKDVQFDEYGAILWLRGKSGTRKRRVYSSVPDLRQYLNSHPRKDESNAQFFHAYNEKLGEKTLYLRIRRLGQRVLGKRIHPHMFRHTKATEDSKHFTDREMMLLFGWKNPDMISVYSHLSLRDVEDKDLILHGLKSKEEIMRPIVQVQKCWKCNEENAPYAIYCNECGVALGKGLGQQDTKDIVDQIIKNPEAFKILRDAMGDIVGAKLSPIEQERKR